MGKTKGRIFVISAPSGSGKTTVCKKVLKKVKNLTRSVSLTTRPRRAREKNRKDYHYVSSQFFRRMAEDGKLLEWEENFGYLYGTPKRGVLDRIKQGRDVLLAIDVKGAMQVKRKFPESALIFLKPPSFRELSRRLASRNTDGKAEISRRLRIAKRELKFIPRYDYVVVNDKLKSAVDEITSIIKKERR